MSPALLAYRAATIALAPLAPLWLRARVRRGKEDEVRWREKLALAPVDRPSGGLVWLHGASVGEGLSLAPLAQAMRAAAPAMTVLITTGTTTSGALLAERLPAGVFHRYAPLDTPGAARRFLDGWRPSLAVFAESEIWPNLLRAARARGVATALVSARLSAASLRGWARAPGAARDMFGGFAGVLAQDDATAQGLLALGARDDGRLNLKLAGDAPPIDAGALAAAREAFGGAPVVLAASTHPGEEAIALDAFRRLDRADARLVIVPRHPARGAEVAATAIAAGFTARRRAAGEPPGSAAVYVADTLGELGLWYAVAASALVGGSLLPGPGGHNPLEPARLSRPILTGPHVANWADVYARLGDAATTVRDPAELAAAWAADLDRRDAALARAARGAERAAAAAGGDLADVARRLLALAA